MSVLTLTHPLFVASCIVFIGLAAGCESPPIYAHALQTTTIHGTTTVSGTVNLPLILANGTAATSRPASPTPTSSPILPPRGIYVLGADNRGVNALMDNYDAAVAVEQQTGLDLFSGYVLRVQIADLITNTESTSGPVHYDFTPIVNAIETIQLETNGVRAEDSSDAMSLMIFIDAELPIIVAQSPATERYIPDPIGAPGVEAPIPWGASAVAFLVDFNTQLSETLVHDYSQPDTPQIVLREHPVLQAVAAFPVGLLGFRDTFGTRTRVRDMPGYNRADFVDGFMASMVAYSNAFPNDLIYVQFFGIDDQRPGLSLTREISESLSDAYNGEGQPLLGVFKENLSEYAPHHLIDSVLLDFEAPGFFDDNEGKILFQMLTSWIRPFNLANSTNREPMTASGSPAFGMMLGYSDFGSRYYEIYITDIILSDAHIRERFRYLPPYGDASGVGTVPVEDIPPLREELQNYVASWNRYLVSGPELVDDSLEISAMDGPVVISALANDKEPPRAPVSRERPPTGSAQVREPLALTITGVTQPANGSVTIGQNGLVLLYEPNIDFVGTDVFTYTVSDGIWGVATANVEVRVKY